MTTKPVPIPTSAEQTYPLVTGKRVTPSNVTPVFSDNGITALTRAIRCGAAGTLTVKYQDGTTHGIDVSEGEWLIMAVTHIMATGTDVSPIDAFR